MTDEPIDDYLWDRSGDEDAALRELEDLLARFRHDQPLAPVVDEDDRRDE